MCVCADQKRHLPVSTVLASPTKQKRLAHGKIKRATCTSISGIIRTCSVGYPSDQQQIFVSNQKNKLPSSARYGTQKNALKIRTSIIIYDTNLFCRLPSRQKPHNFFRAKNKIYLPALALCVCVSCVLFFEFLGLIFFFLILPTIFLAFTCVPVRYTNVAACAKCLGWGEHFTKGNE